MQPPFWVIATQNPIDHEGTFPLPEAQLDRFLVRFSLGYPSMDEELKMLELLEHGNPLDRLEPVVTAEELLAAQQAVRQRPRRSEGPPLHHPDRAEHAELRRREPWAAARGRRWRCFAPSQALAAVSGRNFVRPDDVKQMAGPVLTHRLILRPESRLRKLTAAAVVAEVVADVPVPMLPTSCRQDVLHSDAHPRWIRAAESIRSELRHGSSVDAHEMVCRGHPVAAGGARPSG